MSALVSIEVADDAFAVGEHAGVVVLVWRGEPTRARLERSVESFAAIAQRTRAPLSVLGVAEESSPPPSLSDLAFSARAFDRVADQLVASVMVLEDRSMTSALLDAVARVQALRRRPTRTKFCADTHEAAAWLATRHPRAHGVPGFRSELVSAIEVIRARVR